MLLSLLPASALAAEDSDGLCEHHTEHTEVCYDESGARICACAECQAEGPAEDGEEPAGEPEEAVWVTECIVPDADDLPDSDELFAGYAMKTLYPEYGISAYGIAARDHLTSENDKKIYDQLKTKIEQVASGNLASTEFSVDTSSMSITYTAEGNTITSTSGMDTHAVASALVADCPYELYWYDKTVGVHIGISGSSGKVTTVTFALTVASAYAGSGSYTTDTSKTKAAATAAASAQTIVSRYSDKSDYEKLAGYKNEICDLVSYNTSAADKTTDTPYGDPWQLIYVFDGNTNTNVVCEGYSKAFQYLCDLTDFDNNKVICYTVTGVMTGGTGAGGHMWNIVTMEDGKNYLVDVTNCDTGTVGAPDKLFMKGSAKSGSDANQYTCAGVTYLYDPDQANLYGAEVLELSDTDYTPKTLRTLAITKNPDKTSYFAGEKFDPAGMVVTATYSDGSKVAVTDYTVKNGDQALTAGTTAVWIVYGGFEVYVNITVTNKTVTSIEVTGTFKKVYNVGDAQDWSGLKVILHYIDGSTETKEFKVDSNIDVLNFDSSTPGTKTITVKYGELASTTITITVNGLVLGKDQFNFTPLSGVTYDGASKVVDVSYKGITETEAGAITVKYNGSDTAPTGAGTYKVTVTTAGGSKYGPVTDLELGSFTIAKATPTITASDLTVVKGQKGPLSAATATGLTLTYTSGNTSVATVDASGNVTGVATGTATITISTTGDANYTSASTTVTVTVTDKTAVTVDFSAKAGQKTYDGTAVKLGEQFELGVVTGREESNYRFEYDGKTFDREQLNAVTVADAGEYTVKAVYETANEYGEATATFKIVKAQPTITASDLTVVKGVSAPLKATIDPSDLPLTYQSSDTSVATVDASGNVTGVATGKTTITISYAGDGNHGPATATVTLTVTEKTSVEVTFADAASKPYTEAGYKLGEQFTAATVANGGTAKYVYDGKTYATLSELNVIVTAIGTYTVKAVYETDTEYGEATATFTITKAAQDPLNITSAGPVTYGDTLNLTTTGGSGTGEVTYTVTNGDGSATINGNVLTPTKTGTVTVTATKAGDDNYEAVTSEAVTITIKKAAYSGTTAFTKNILTNKAQTVTMDVTQLLPGIDGLHVSTVTLTSGNGVVTAVKAPTAETATKVIFDVASVAEAGKTAAITATLNCYNYEEFTIAITVTTVDKDDARVSFTGAVPTSKTYGDGAFTLAVTAADPGENGVWTWTSSDSAVLTVENGTVTIKKAGSATITAHYESDTTMGDLTAAITVNKANVTVKPADLRCYVNSTAPELVLAYQGLVGSDKLTLSEPPAFKLTDKDGKEIKVEDAVKTRGTYTITWTNLDETTISGAENYNVTTQATGTLTVTTRSSGGSGSSNTTTETTKNKDGSTTTTVTNKSTGTITETTTYKDGSTLVVETKKNGTVTTTETAANGVKVKTVDEPGEDVTASVKIPKKVGETTVVIPADVEPGTVAVNAKTGEIIKLSVPVKNGLAVKLDASANLILVDNSKDFTDTRRHWAEDAIDFVSAHELFNGTTATTFTPDASTTRGQLMTVLARLDGADTTGAAIQKGMAWAVERGISDGTNPNARITREQLAAMLYRYAGNPDTNGSLEGFSDAGRVSGYAVDAMRWAVSTGLIGGMGDGTLNPQGPATRAQVATILMRFCGDLAE